MNHMLSTSPVPARLISGRYIFPDSWSLSLVSPISPLWHGHQCMQDRHHSGGGSWMTKWELGTSTLPSASQHFSLCRRTDFSGQYYPFRDSMPSVYFYFGSLWGWHCQKGPRLGIKTQCERHRAGGYVPVTPAASRFHNKRKKWKQISTQPSSTAPVPQRICQLSCFGLF